MLSLPNVQALSKYLRESQVHTMFEQTWFMVCVGPPGSDCVQAAVSAREVAS